METLISTFTTNVELTVGQRLELAEKVYQTDFDLGIFGFGTESITTDEVYHNMIDNYYPGIPRKAEAVAKIELRKH
jgi:hypothetical protein